MLAAASSTLALPAEAARFACGDRPCDTKGTVKGTAIFPPDNEFTLRGDIFSNDGRDLIFNGDGYAQVNLGFSVNFGFGAQTSLFVGKNGLVTFGAPPGAFQRGASLGQLGGSVIAPYYAMLATGPGAGDTRLGVGDVVVQQGLADPYANGGFYDKGEARSALRISWYGLNAANGQPVYTQLLLTGGEDELSTFEFRYGTLDAPGQADYGATAGFVFGNTSLEFDGPFTQGVPTFFEFSDGVFVGQGATVAGAVPEPSVWAQMMLGFGLAGYALRRRRYRLGRANALGQSLKVAIAT